MKTRLLILSLFFIWAPLAAQYPTKPNPVVYVNDYANVLSEADATLLHRKLLDTYKENNQAFQLIIVTVNNMGGQDIKTYSQGLAQTWGIGSKENNGILLLMAKTERKVRIETGYGMEDKVTDAQAADIIDNILIPEFKNGQFYSGFDKATTKLIQLCGGTVPNPPVVKDDNQTIYNPGPTIYTPEEPKSPNKPTPKKKEESFGSIIMGVMLLFVCLIILVAIFSTYEAKDQKRYRTYSRKANIRTTSYSDYSDYSDSSRNTYSDYSDTKYSDYSDYKDYSDYSDYSDSSFGGGSFGGGGADGSW